MVAAHFEDAARVRLAHQPVRFTEPGSKQRQGEAQRAAGGEKRVWNNLFHKNGRVQPVVEGYRLRPPKERPPAPPPRLEEPRLLNCRVLAPLLTPPKALCRDVLVEGRE